MQSVPQLQNGVRVGTTGVHEVRPSLDSEVTGEFETGGGSHDQSRRAGERSIAESRRVDWMECGQSHPAGVGHR